MPRLPRGRGMRFSTPEILRILLFAGMLVAVIVLARPCGNAVSRFVMRFDNGSNAAGSGSATPQMPKPGNVEAPGKPVQTLRPEQYEHLRPGMSEQEIKAAMERARQRAAAAAAGSAAGSGSGTAAGSAAGSGSGTGTAAGSAAGTGSGVRP